MFSSLPLERKRPPSMFCEARSSRRTENYNPAAIKLQKTFAIRRDYRFKAAQ